MQKSKLILIACLIVGLIPTLSEACQRYSDETHDHAGNVIASANIQVTITGTIIPATIYSDPLCATVKPNPTQSGSDGLFTFFIKDGIYDLTTTRTGYSFNQATYISIFDPLGENIVTVANYTTTDICATGVGAIDQNGATLITLVINKPVTCSRSVTIPATLKVQFMGGGLITVATGKILTFYRPENILAPPDHTIMAGDGTFGFTIGGHIPVGWAGLRGDASTDNCALMNKLITWIPASGATIDFGDGTYNTTCNFTAITQSDVKVMGRGIGVTKIVRSTFDTSGGSDMVGGDLITYATAQRGILTFLGVSRIEISGLYFQGTGDVATPNGVSPYTGKGLYAVAVADLYVHDTHWIGLDNETIYCEDDCPRVRFDRNIIEDVPWAALNINSNHTTSDKSYITNNIVVDAGAGAIQTTGVSVEVSGNRISCPTADGADQILIERTQNFVVANNIIENCNVTLDGVALLMIRNAGEAAPPLGGSGVVIGNVFRNNNITGTLNNIGVLTFSWALNGTVLVTGNLFDSNCNTINQEVAGIAVNGATTPPVGQIHIVGNQFHAGTRCAGTGNQTTGIFIAATATSNNVSIGTNRFEADVTSPYVFNVEPLGGRERKSIWISGQALSSDGAQCAQPARVTINSGALLWTVICTDNDASTIYGNMIMPDNWNGGPVTLQGSFIQTAADTNPLNADVSMACRVNGDTINNTWGTEIAMDIANMGGSNKLNTVTTAAITPDGTCTGNGTMLEFRWQMDAGGTTTAVATLHVVGFKLEYNLNGGFE